MNFLNATFSEILNSATDKIIKYLKHTALILILNMFKENKDKETFIPVH